MSKTARLWVLGACVAGVGCSHPGPMTLEATVEQAIREFQPAWQPPKGEMKGLIVLIVPLACEAGLPDDTDRITLQTAGYLYHAIRAADGIPVLYRTDLDLLPSAASLDRADLVRTAASARCDLCVIIDRHATGRETAHQAAVQPASADGMSDTFARVAAEKLDAVVGPDNITEGLIAPAIRIRPAFELSFVTASFSPPAYRARAERMYGAIAAFAIARRESLIGSRASRWPQTAPSEVDLAAVRPIRSEAEKTESIARTIWPSGDLPPERAAWFCSVFRRISLSDNTEVYFDPQVALEADGIVLRGATTVPALARTLEAALRTLGVAKVRNEMRSLPEDGHLDGPRFAAVIVSTARTYTIASEPGSGQTQLLYGEPIYLLDRREGWYLAQAGDGYWGWVREEAIRPVDGEQFTSCLAHRQAVTVGTVYVGRRPISSGARLPLVGESPPNRLLRAPTGEVLTVPADLTRVIDDSEACRRRVLSALRLLYVPYVFGARSPQGLDCSGLVYRLFERDGLPLARDATQQMLSGKLVATRWFRSAIQPGDRLYFIDAFGKVFHTGIAISPTHFVHSCPPGVQISSLRKGDRLYNEMWDDCLVAAKRP